MERKPSEAGSTLLEVILVVAIVATLAGALGAFSAAGPSVAVSAAATAISSAFDEARRTAVAFDAATVVFAPAAAGSGFSVRVYRRLPGDAAFAPGSGPAYESATAAAETAAPLGSPGMAFALDRHGSVTGYAAFRPDAPAFDTRPCPAAGAFTIAVRSGAQARTVTVPCASVPAGIAPVALDTAPPPVTPAPVATPAIACAGSPCPLPTLIAATAPSPAPTAQGTSPPVHQQVADRCGTPAGQLAYTDTTTTPPTDHLTDGVACSVPTATPNPAPAFPGSVTIGFWVEECPGGIATCDGGNLVEDESPEIILGGPVDYVACNIDPHPLGALPRSITTPGEWQGSSIVAPFSPFQHLETRWDIVVPPGVHLTIADGGSDGC